MIVGSGCDSDGGVGVGVLGLVGADRVLGEVVDRLLEAELQVGPDRVAVTGGSYGGYATLADWPQM